MRFHVTHPLISHPYHPELVTGEGVVRLARAAEAAGFDGYGFTDHPAPTQAWLEAGGHDALDPFVALGVVAAVTSTIRLIPNIVVLPYRNPFVVAKAAAPLDSLSGGRFTLATGVGYLEGEYAALGVCHSLFPISLSSALAWYSIGSTTGISMPRFCSEVTTSMVQLSADAGGRIPPRDGGVRGR